MVKRYWTLSKRGGRPAEARRVNWVNKSPLPDDFVQALDSELALLDSSWLLAVLSDPETHGPPGEWEAVEVDGDAETAVIPRKSERLEGSFVKAFGELRRIPVTDWIDQARQSDQSELREAAEKQTITMEVAAEGYD